MTNSSLRVIGIAWYLAEDYGAIRRIMTDRDELPDTFIEWRTKAEKVEQKKRSEGYIVVRAIIDPETFADWCRTRRLNVDAQARMQFANLIAKEHHGGTH